MSDDAARTHLPLFENVSATTILREMFDRANIGMALADVETRRFLRVNAKLSEITGYSEKELLNTTAVALTYPPDREADRDSFERFTRGETDRRVVEKRYVRPDGSTVWVRITTTIVQFAGVRCSFGITEDISERRAALAALQAAEQRKNLFLATLAHELRNPLAAIRNSCAVLRQLANQETVFQHVRSIIDRQSQALEGLVDDLLDSARITAGKITLNKSYVGVADVVTEAVETVDHQLQARGHDVSLAVPAQNLSVYGDKLRLVQILVNLLTNAIKHTPEGGRIGVDATADKNEVVISVTDTGSGIAADELPHVFNLFEQAGQSASSAEGGLGIGLAITKRLVELHGGRIQVRSHVGLGSTFKVSLPHVDRRVQPAGRGAAARHAPARIMIIEDNTDVADSMAMLLIARGHEVRIAGDGAGALNTLNDWSPDVFLIDLGLPDIHGCELVTRLRAKDTTKAAYMIAVSGYGQRSDVERSLQAGFDKHLTKPVDFDALLALISADRRASSAAGAHR
jgi:PAS domain S-box-containing protein